MIKPDLKELTAYWQARLRLQDWQLEVAYVKDLAAPDGSPVYGLCYPFVDNKQAKIFIRDPETSKPLPMTAPSIEKVVVHELCHLHFAPLSGTSKAEVAAEEQAVWALSGAMVAARGTSDEPVIMRAMLGQFSAPARRKKETDMPVTERRASMDADLVKQALDALQAGDDAKAAELLKGIIASAAWGSDAAPPAPEGDEPPESAPGAPGEAKAPPPTPPPSGGGSAPPGPPGEDEKKKPPMGAKAPSPLPLPRKAAAMKSTDPAVAALAAQVQELTDKQAATEAAAIATERATVLAARIDLAKGLRAMIANVETPIETVRAIAAAVPAPPRAALVPTTEMVTGTLGNGVGDRATAQLPAEQAAQLHRAMGIIPEGSTKPSTNEAGQWIRPIETPTQARARMAAAPKGQG